MTRVTLRLSVETAVSRMKLPNGPTLCGGELATRPPQVNDGADCTRDPSHTEDPVRDRISYASVFLSISVASGKRYGIAPNPAVLRLAIELTCSALRQKFGPAPVTE